MRSIYTKTLFDRRSFIIGWTIALVGIAVLMAVFFPAMRQQGALDELLKQMPPAFEGLIGNLSNLSNFDTYIASQLFDIRLPLIVGIMSIVLGLGLSTREEESGELRTILALPISRTKTLIQKWLALCTVMVIATLGLVVGIYVSVPFIEGASIEPLQLAQLAFMTFLIMTCFGTITFAAGMATGRRAVANAVGVFTIIGSFFISTFAVAVDWLEPFTPLSLLNYFPAVKIVTQGIRSVDVIVLLAVIAVALMTAWVRFRRRDIA